MFHFKKEFFFFWSCLKACGLSCPQGIESAPPALGVQSLNHWTTKEVPVSLPKKKKKN